MNLTDAEKRDVVELIQEGKPLPDGYRFKLFGDKREVELVWNGKTNEVTNVVLPFQTIEQVDEPREEADTSSLQSLFDLDDRGRQVGDWTNKLIWGDNKLILSSLKNGPLREEIEKQGGIKLIYIDPPFDVGADFSMDVEIGDETLTKKPSVLEQHAYRDTWGKGTDSFIAMMYERLNLMRDLLAENGSIYVHCDWRVTSYMRLILDEIFGSDRLVNEIIWKRQTSSGYKGASGFGKNHDTLWLYSKGDSYHYKSTYKSYSDDYVDSHYNKVDKNGRRYRTHWVGTKTTKETIEKGLKTGKYVKREDGSIEKRLYLDEQPGVAVDSIWTGVKALTHGGGERFDYPTQKPEALLERIVSASSSKGDLIADFFMGSGTLPAAAEKLGRKWIGSDLGKFSIHTTRKRMIQVQRQLKEDSNSYRAFELLNLGKYEREYFVGVNSSLSDEDQKRQLSKKEEDFTRLILKAYKAQATEGFRTFKGKKAARMVSIGPINLPVSSNFVEEVIKEALDNKISKVDILAFEFEMGLFPAIQEEAKERGVDLDLKYIPPDVFDKRAVDKDEVTFHDVAYIEVKPHYDDNSIAIELTDFAVFYNQDTDSDVEKNLRAGSSKVVIRNGQVIQISKDKKSGVVSQEVLTKEWTDWIDYWSVDFDFESKKEIIRRPKQTKEVQDKLDGSTDMTQLEPDDYEQYQTGDYIFENEWQSFRTKKDRSIELKTPLHEYSQKKRYKVAVKVVDIFGNDTMKVVEVNL